MTKSANKDDVVLRDIATQMNISLNEAKHLRNFIDEQQKKYGEDKWREITLAMRRLIAEAPRLDLWALLQCGVLFDRAAPTQTPNSAADLRAWAMEREARELSEEGKAERRSAAARKAWNTREKGLSDEEKAERRSAAARKAWETMRARGSWKVKGT